MSARCVQEEAALGEETTEAGNQTGWSKWDPNDASKGEPRWGSRKMQTTNIMGNSNKHLKTYPPHRQIALRLRILNPRVIPLLCAPLTSIIQC